jgi:glyceraldehyde-3-phosphate dehydrogenase/erythrose-4-phosphate dehydrogenase
MQPFKMYSSSGSTELTSKNQFDMKKTSEKKLQLGKIKVASLSQSKPNGENIYTVSFKVCTNDISQGAPICSVDSCRF